MLKEINANEMDSIVGGETEVCFNLVVVEVCVGEEELEAAADYVVEYIESEWFAH
ncbi:MAG: bacteriocin [Trueperaceae bacterium]